MVLWHTCLYIINCNNTVSKYKYYTYRTRHSCRNIFWFPQWGVEKMLLIKNQRGKTSIASRRSGYPLPPKVNGIYTRIPHSSVGIYQLPILSTYSNLYWCSAAVALFYTYTYTIILYSYDKILINDTIRINVDRD